MRKAQCTSTGFQPVRRGCHRFGVPRLRRWHGITRLPRKLGLFPGSLKRGFYEAFCSRQKQAEPAAIQVYTQRPAGNMSGAGSPTAKQPFGAGVAAGAAESCW
jgi:hypothetical protein